MGVKVYIFLGAILFVMIFPVFIQFKNSPKKDLNYKDLTITNGVVYKYSHILKEKILFKKLQKQKNLFFLDEIDYVDLINNYHIKAKNAIYNEITKTLQGGKYIFSSSTIKGRGNAFKKEKNFLYANNVKFLIKD